MNGTLSDNLIRAAGQLDSAAGVAVVYCRSSTVAPCTLRPCNPDWSSAVDTGIIESWIGLDFVCEASVWAALGFGNPSRGDWILWGGIKWSVTAPKQLQVFDIPAYGESIRIHTKQGPA
jgi:hypothetical protein